MATLKLANNYLREGNFQKALEVFDALRKTHPNFSIYEKGYSLAKQNIVLNGPTNHDMNLLFSRTVAHPESQDAKEIQCKIVVVTPVFNGADFLQSTLESILHQKGNFFIDYRVIDGCSSDKTLEILSNFQNRMEIGEMELRCNGITFTVQSSPDCGLYDAVARGFEIENTTSHPNDILAYLNADDVFAPGAFQIASHVFENTNARWICGQIHTINCSGETIHSTKFPLVYSREDILEGLHIGEKFHFIQQEGTFWLRELYDAVGGVDRSMKRAADFLLWQKFASQTELLAMDRPLANFRARPGQLSEQFYKYKDEIFGLIRNPDKKAAPEVCSQGNPPLFHNAENAPGSGLRQRPGPLCFLHEDGTIREIAYISRCYYSRE